MFLDLDHCHAAPMTSSESRIAMHSSQGNSGIRGHRGQGYRPSLVHIGHFDCDQRRWSSCCRRRWPPPSPCTRCSLSPSTAILVVGHFREREYAVSPHQSQSPQRRQRRHQLPDDHVMAPAHLRVHRRVRRYRAQSPFSAYSSWADPVISGPSLTAVTVMVTSMEAVAPYESVAMTVTM